MCWQVPIRLEHSTDENGHVTSRLREWKRRDWGEGGNEFHWWCTEAPEAFTGDEPVYRSARDEIVELVGPGPYEAAVKVLERADWTPLPHPTVRTTSALALVVLVVELDAVLGGEGGVILFFATVLVIGDNWGRPVSKTEIEGSRARLLQLSCFFEATMTTLLHAGLPHLEK